MEKKRKKICDYDELPDPGSKGINIDSLDLNIFVVKENQQIFVYENSCPHTSGPLDWMPDEFLDEDKKYIMCANHGAIFKINNGLCVYGPCKDQSLRNVPFILENGEIFLLV